MSDTADSKEVDELEEIVIREIVKTRMARDTVTELTESILQHISSKYISREKVTKALNETINLNDIYGNDHRNNYGYNETQVRDAANWLQGKLRAKLLNQGEIK